MDRPLFPLFRSDVDIDIIEKDGYFDIFYVLNDPGEYDLDIKFGGQNIPGGTFSIKVDQSGLVTGW